MKQLITPDGNHLVASCETCHIYTLLRGLIAQLEKEAVREEEIYLENIGKITGATYRLNSDMDLAENEASKLRNVTLVKLTEDLCREKHPGQDSGLVEQTERLRAGGPAH